MGVRKGNKNIIGMRFNGFRIASGKINNKTVFNYGETPFMTFTIDTTKISSENKEYVLPFYEAIYPENIIGEITILWGDGTKTKILDGNITRNINTHEYETEGEYIIKIYSSNGIIPLFLVPTTPTSHKVCLTSINTPILKMANTSSTNIDISHMFDGCSNMISIPVGLFKNNSLGLETDFSYLFYGCSSLEYIPEDLFNSNKTLLSLESAFENCSSLINIPTYLFRYLSLVTNFKSCFKGCTNLESIPSYLFRYNSSVINFESCFENCNNAVINMNIFCNENTESSVRFAISSQINFSRCFYKSENLTESKGRAPRLWNYKYLLDPNSSSCYSGNGNNIDSLSNYDIIPIEWGGIYNPEFKFTINPGLNPNNNQDTTFIVPFSPYQSFGGTITIDWGDGTSSEIVDMTSQANCTHVYAMTQDYQISLTSSNKKFPMFKFSNYFSNNENSRKLKSIDDLGSYVLYNESYKASACDHMFFECSNLEMASLDSYDTTGSTNMSYMFYYCSSLVSLNLNSFNTESVINASYMFYLNLKLKSLDLNHFDVSNLENASHMFAGCEAMTTLNVDNWNTASLIDMNNMFNDMNNIVTVGLNNWNTSNVTDMRGLFNYCHKLTNPNMANLDMSKVVDASYMFAICESLASFSAPNWNLAQATTLKNMFAGDVGLTSININNWNVPNVSIVNNMFNNCENVLEFNLNNWTTGSLTDMQGLFYSCDRAQRIYLASWNTSLATNMKYTFYNNVSLNKIYVGTGWNTSRVSESNNMFYNCTNLSGDISYNSSYTDKTYAKYIGGYLTKY